MVSGVDLPTNQNSLLIEAASGVAAINQSKQDTILNSTQLVVGKQYEAEVIAKLENGTYVVNVADTAARMQLPNSPQVGAKLQLTLISTSPRATFLINTSNESEVTTGNATTTLATLGTAKQLIDNFTQTSVENKSNSSTGLYLSPGSSVATLEDIHADPQLIALTTSVPESAPAIFSSAGKLVGQLLQDMPQQGSVVMSNIPLLDAPNVAPEVLAHALQSGVASSGVFYESHLLQWAEGRLDVTQLMKEPQARFTSPSENTSHLPHVPLVSLVSEGIVATNAIAAAISSDNPTITISKEATPLLQQQLQTLEQQRFVWHGELWPGQHLEWEVSRDNSKQQQNQSDDARQSAWQSAVRFELPQLGSVSAQIHLTGNRLSLTVNTQDASSTEKLQNHASELIGALEGTGTKLDSFLIKTKP